VVYFTEVRPCTIYSWRRDLRLAADGHFVAALLLGFLLALDFTQRAEQPFLLVAQVIEAGLVGKRIVFRLDLRHLLDQAAFRIEDEMTMTDPPGDAAVIGHEERIRLVVRGARQLPDLAVREVGEEDVAILRVDAARAVGAVAAVEAGHAQ